MKRIFGHMRANCYCIYKLLRCGEVWQVFTVESAGRCMAIGALYSNESRFEVFWQDGEQK